MRPRFRWRKDLTPQSRYKAGDALPAGAMPAMAEPETEDELPGTGGTSKELLAAVLHRLEEDKAENIITISLTGKSEIADAMVIASGRSQTHVGAMADKLMRELKEKGFGNANAEGMPANDWVLLDAGDVIVHLFRPEVREFYNLEKIWSEEAFGKAGIAAGR